MRNTPAILNIARDAEQRTPTIASSQAQVNRATPKKSITIIFKMGNHLNEGIERARNGKEASQKTAKQIRDGAVIAAPAGKALILQSLNDGHIASIIHWTAVLPREVWTPYQIAQTVPLMIIAT